MSEEKLIKIDLGCGTVKAVGYIGIDKVQIGNTIDIVMDFDSPTVSLGFGDNSVDEVRASHVLEHIHNLFPLMNEVWRILKPGGRFDIVVPLAPSRAAFDDPTHVRFFTKASFHYFTKKAPGNQIIPDIKGTWSIVKNDWSPEFIEEGDRTILPEVKELHVIMIPDKEGEEDEAINSNPNVEPKV